MLLAFLLHERETGPHGHGLETITWKGLAGHGLESITAKA
jgi:hypothetical protein